MEPGKRVPVGIHRRLSFYRFLWHVVQGTYLGQLYGFYGNPNLNPEKSKSGKARLKA